jgi:hypothetical protein
MLLLRSVIFIHISSRWAERSITNISFSGTSLVLVQDGWLVDDVYLSWAELGNNNFSRLPLQGKSSTIDGASMYLSVSQ